MNHSSENILTLLTTGGHAFKVSSSWEEKIVEILGKNSSECLSIPVDGGILKLLPSSIVGIVSNTHQDRSDVSQQRTDDWKPLWIKEEGVSSYCLINMLLPPDLLQAVTYETAPNMVGLVLERFRPKLEEILAISLPQSTHKLFAGRVSNGELERDFLSLDGGGILSFLFFWGTDQVRVKLFEPNTNPQSGVVKISHELILENNSLLLFPSSFPYRLEVNSSNALDNCIRGIWAQETDPHAEAIASA